MSALQKSPVNLKIAAVVVALLTVVGGGTYVAVKGGKSSSGTTASENPDDNKVVAKIDGKAVTLGEMNLRIQAMQQGQGKKVSFNDLSAESKAVIVREEAAHRALIKDAKKQDLLSKDIIKKETDAFLDNLLQKAALEKAANSAINDKIVKETYEKEAAKLRGQQEVRARHILVKTQEEAEKVKTMLDTKSFKDVAKEMSIDQKTAKEGGDLGILYTGNMLKEFDEAIAKLKPGETSEPVKSEFGWHVIKLDSRNPAKILPFEQAKDSVTIDLSKKAIKEYVDELLKDIKIEVL